jgi:predicted PurR-regulated permease PerM
MQIERQIVFWIAALVVFAGLLWLLSPILLPFVLGLVIAYALDPLARRLKKRGINRAFAAFIILGGFLLLIVILSLLILPRLWSQAHDVIEHPEVYEQGLQDIGNKLAPYYVRLMRLLGADSTNGDISQAINQAVQYFRNYLGSFFDSAFFASLLQKGRSLISIFSLLIITPVVAFYLICDWDRMLEALDGLVPLSQRDTLRSLCREVDTTISAYVRGQSGVCLILGSYYAVVLTLMNLKFGLLIGLVAGLLSFIPYVGSLVALVASLGMAMVQTDPTMSWTRVVFVGVLVLVGQFAEGYVLSPKLVGHSVGLNPVWLMFALFAFGYLFGFVGLLLAVPLAAAAGVLARFAVRRYRGSLFYTGSPLS